MLNANTVDRELVLVGGGHSHVEVLRRFALQPPKRVRLTLVARDVLTPYSGMLPGYLAGHYTLDQCHIDLAPLARQARARLLHVTGTYALAFCAFAALRSAVTGVPLLVDVAAMRDAAVARGTAAEKVEPLVPVDLVVDHSVQVDFSGSQAALNRNMEIQFIRNRERYEFLKWGQQAFETFSVVPPGIGIVHQVNLEYLAKGVLEKDGT